MLSPLRITSALIFLGLATMGPAHAAGRQLVASDMLQIKVVGQPDLDSQVRIDTDGSITFPYLGRVQAAGLTEDGLAEEIKRGLIKAAIVKRPQVIVSTVQGAVYYLYGYVIKPGEYPLMRTLTVQQALAAGGGIAPLGSEWRIQIKRRTPDGKVMEKSASLDDEVLPNDTIVVNERLF
jgi:protein involved in polysaccharide export with SLBB domain